MMKKTTFAAILAFLFMAAGSLTAVALHLARRERELDEYEKLLFADTDGDDEENDEENDEGKYHTVDLPFEETKN